MQEWEPGWFEEPEDERPVFNNTCYICGLTWLSHELAEICSAACLDREAEAEICAHEPCRKLYWVEPTEPSNYCSDDCRFDAAQARKVSVLV